MSTSPKKIIRTAFVSLVAVAGAFHSVRTAVINGTLGNHLEIARSVWPEHPRVELAVAMADIGAAASARRLPGADSLRLANAAARHAPLAVEPFLISGAWAQSEGKQERAEGLFVEASRRDPRSQAAQFFLAQRYLATGRMEEGLKHALVLVRLVSGGSAALAPALAEYAKSPAAIPALRKTFATNPEMQDLVLANLATDRNNYTTIMSLAGDKLGPGSMAAAPQWQSQLLRGLIDGGELARARLLWLRISGLKSDPKGIFNPGFKRSRALPPFNWTFGTGDYGFAEPTGSHGLNVSYYGLATADFAQQTMLLGPGNYELSMQVIRDAKADPQSGLTWSIGCTGEAKSLMYLSLSTPPGKKTTISGKFAVPASCRSQSIKLSAIPIQFGSSEQVIIDDLKLVSDVK